MKIAIIGAGGVGSYIGAKLLKASNNVSFLARGAHLTAIKANGGLKVFDENIHFSVSSNYFFSSFEKDEKFDFIIFTTKAYSLEDALEQVRTNITPETILMSIANGVEHDKVILKHYPNNPVCSACIYILSNISEPGSVKKYGGVLQLIIGSSTVEPKSIEELYHLFNNAHITTKASQNIDLECWRKYLFISSFAIMTSFYNESMGEIIKKHEEELTDVLQEIVLVANKKGIGLTQKNIDQVIFQAKNKIPYNSKTSMQLDFEKSKQSEIYALCGYLIDEAHKFGMELKVIESLYKWLLIKANN